MSTMFTLLHIAVAVDFICWFITMVKERRYFSSPNIGNVGSQQKIVADGLKEAATIVVKWGTVFTLFDIISHILAWLFNLASMDTNPLYSLYIFTCVIFLAGIAGMIYSVIALLTNRSASQDCVDLIKTARKLPFRMILFSLISTTILAIISC